MQIRWSPVPFIVVYRLLTHAVEIVNVIHGAQHGQNLRSHDARARQIPKIDKRGQTPCRQKGMRSLSLLALTFTVLAQAQQPATRSVHLDAASPKEAAAVLRVVCDTRNVSVDETASSVSFTDTPDAVALAEWSLKAIDTTEPAAQEYRVPGVADERIEVIYLANTKQAGTQEMLTQLRTVAGLAKVFNFYGRHAVVLRGDSALLAASTWLIAQLDKPFDANAMAVSFAIPGALDGDNLRVYYLHNISASKPTQELLTTLRVDAKTQHAFVSTAPRAVAVRSTADQVAQADQIVARLDARAAN
jgi:type II secretory pathway component GspD/PulD (secretin)